jgi:ATP-dependent DNA ligase
MRSRAVRERGELVSYFVFDLLFLNGRDLRALPLIERKARLKKSHLRYVDYIETRGEAMYEHAVKIGLEGVVGKKADSQYIGGRRREWGTHRLLQKLPNRSIQKLSVRCVDSQTRRVSPDRRDGD